MKFAMSMSGLGARHYPEVAEVAEANGFDSVWMPEHLIFPAEMPSGWAPEALKAQAVAARSYALANLAKGRPFDLYSDTRSQVYGGVKAESTKTSAAVDATKGEVVLFNGKVADTLFFSTSGGRTASALESTGCKDQNHLPRSRAGSRPCHSPRHPQPPWLSRSRRR